MGLKEKRMIQQQKDEVLPSISNELKEISGAEIEWDVDWDSFSKSLEALYNIENQGLRRILDAFRDVCKDDIGKEAVQEGVKKIVVRNFDDASEVKNTFDAGTGVLTVYGAWAASWEGYPQASEIRDILEEGL